MPRWGQEVYHCRKSCGVNFRGYDLLIDLAVGDRKNDEKRIGKRFNLPRFVEVARPRDDFKAICSTTNSIDDLVAGNALLPGGRLYLLY